MKGAVIGGTGCQSFLPPGVRERVVQSRYGEVLLYEDDDIVYLLRHRIGHTVPPHLINYRAHIDALRSAGVQRVVAIYAVGSITQALMPGTAGVLGQFIDFTSNRENTFYSESGQSFRHTPMDEPYSRALSRALIEQGAREGIALARDLTYVCTNGPRLETPAEIAMYRTFGCDVVGMTAGSETSLACEAGIEFAGIAYSINWAAGVGGSQVSFIQDDMIEDLTGNLTVLARNTLLSI